MAAEGIDAILWRVCQASDLRALLGHGGGHEVIAWGKRDLWRQAMGIEVRQHSRGGTQISLEAEVGAAGSGTLSTYIAQARNNEVRVQVPPLISDGRSLVQVAQAATAAIDPDGARTDQLVALLIRTRDGKYHLRGMLRSELPEAFETEVAASGTNGRSDFAGIILDDIEAHAWSTLIAHRNVLLYGPAGTGKTRLMLKLRAVFEGGADRYGFNLTDVTQPLQAAPDLPHALPDPPESRFVTFHQSLSYENFVVGLQPVLAGAVPTTAPRTTKATKKAATTTATSQSAKALQFQVRSGMFLRLASNAILNGGRSLLLVDEFNRGNVADILGELITILEPDKRLGEDGQPTPTTVKVSLPHEPSDVGLPGDFAMPHHFYALASMNSLDRSVAPIDSALRRRFRLIHIEPRPEVVEDVLLQGASVVTTVADPAQPSRTEIGSIALNMMIRINDHVRSFWGPEFRLGHSYFLGTTTVEALALAYNETILPQLDELYRDAPQGLAELLGAEDGVPTAEALAKQPSGSGVDPLGLSGTPALETLMLDPASPADVTRRLYRLAFGAGLP